MQFYVLLGNILIYYYSIECIVYYRDLGDRIRLCIKAAFNTEQGFTGDLKECQQKYESLNRLISNQHGNLFKRNKTHSSTGLTAQECNLVLSSDFLEYLQQEERSIFARILPTKD